MHFKCISSHGEERNNQESIDIGSKHFDMSNIFSNNFMHFNGGENKMFNDGTIHGGLEVADEATTPNLTFSVPNLSGTIRSKYQLDFYKYT